jgi:CoA-transferase family III
MGRVPGDVPDERWPALLAQAWAALEAASGGPGDAPLPRLAGAPAAFEVTGDPGQLPSQLAVEDTAIACAGAALLAAAALGAQRGHDGPRPPGGTAPQTARLDRGQLAAAVRSEAYLRVNGKRSGPGFAPLSRFWQAADGWVRTHGNYPWHADALRRALGVPDASEAVAAAIAGLRAGEVEDLVTGAGGIATEVRSAGDWLASPPGQAVTARRLVEGTQLGDAPGRVRLPGSAPATGVRVLDLTRVIAGPVATRYLAALGADVLRLDSPHRPELPLHARDGLPGKRSALLDLGDADGIAGLHELLSGADVLVHGYRPHALDRFGLTPDALAERHPGLVVVSLSAWGSTGPWGGRRGFDSIVQAACGIAVAESGDGERPGALPCQLLDHGTGYLCAAAALQALARQATHGGTQFRELALARTASWLLSQDRQEPAAHPAGPAAGQPGWFITLDSAEGPVTMVRPPGELNGSGLSWPGPLHPYGGDPARWS